MNIDYRPLTEDDIRALTAVMKRSFDHDTNIHTGRSTGGPPGYDNGDFLRTWGLHPHSIAFCIDVDGELAGGLILWVFPSNHNRLGAIFLDPKFIGKGIGRQTWQWIESAWPETVVWETDTPLYSTANLRFYVNTCGFHMIRIDADDDLPEGIAVLRKEMEIKAWVRETGSV